MATSYACFLPDCLHGLLPGRWTVNVTRFLFFLLLILFVSALCARLIYSSRQLLSARKYTISYRIVSVIYNHYSLVKRLCHWNLSNIVSPAIHERSAEYVDYTDP